MGRAENRGSFLLVRVFFFFFCGQGLDFDSSETNN